VNGKVRQQSHSEQSAGETVTEIIAALFAEGLSAVMGCRPEQFLE